jgi:hypothetical protein
VQQFVMAFRDGDDQHTETEEFEAFDDALRYASDMLVVLGRGRPSVHVALGEYIPDVGIRWLGSVHLSDAYRPVWTPDGGVN